MVILSAIQTFLKLSQHVARTVSHTNTPVWQVGQRLPHDNMDPSDCAQHCWATICAILKSVLRRSLLWESNPIPFLDTLHFQGRQSNLHLFLSSHHHFSFFLIVLRTFINSATSVSRSLVSFSAARLLEGRETVANYKLVNTGLLAKVLTFSVAVWPVADLSGISAPWMAGK